MARFVDWIVGSRVNLFRSGLNRCHFFSFFFFSSSSSVPPTSGATPPFCSDSGAEEECNVEKDRRWRHGEAWARPKLLYRARPHFVDNNALECRSRDGRRQWLPKDEGEGARSARTPPTMICRCVCNTSNNSKRHTKRQHRPSRPMQDRPPRLVR